MTKLLYTLQCCKSATQVPAICVLALLLSAALNAEENRTQTSTTIDSSEPKALSKTAILEEVVTTARKREEAEIAQDIAGAISVLGREQLDERHIKDLEDLSYALPNVALDGIGTGKGIANFSIRGMGVAGSIPSIDPTVGVFVNGVYLGINYGVIADMTDIEAVEVLRGPQGLLFGRNVTGGAVLLRSRLPKGESSANAAIRIESGIEKRLNGAIEESFAQGAVDFRLAGSYRDDDGWFTNGSMPGEPFGLETSWTLRPTLTITPIANLDVAVIFERGSSDGDGPATQNRWRYRGFDFAIDESGYSNVDWGHAIIESNFDNGHGTFTNVFGVRTVLHDSLADVDSTTDPIFHLRAYTDQSQISNELRYFGRISTKWETTTGFYFFGQRIHYGEQRVIRGTWGTPFGGDQWHRTGGVFINNDFHISEHWALSAGVRYTIEAKAVKVASAGTGNCDTISNRCTYDFEDDDSWRNLTPRLVLQRWFGERTHLYGQWTRGFRSGGFNLRNTSPTALPGPFDEEEQDAFELGLKTATPHLRTSVAAFRYRVRGLQRQVTTADFETGGIQITANTADATVQGIEAEVTTTLFSRCAVAAFLALSHGAYDHVLYDLNGDGSTAGDEELDLPRLAPKTYGVECKCHRHLGRLGLANVRVSLAHRDDAEISIDNTGVLDGGNVVDASVSLEPSKSLRVTLYGRNLLNEVFRRSHFELTGLVDSVYSPMKEGRVIGIQATWTRAR